MYTERLKIAFSSLNIKLVPYSQTSLPLVIKDLHSMINPHTIENLSFLDNKVTRFNNSLEEKLV